MIYDEAKAAFLELVQIKRDDFRTARLVVVGASSSEAAGGVIGKNSQPQLGGEIARAILDAAKEAGARVAFQCCEHLNRALVVEESTALEYGLEIVSVVPHPKAGGSVASAAYRMMDKPVVVERVQADAGLDIGDTLIGMHILPVAVPVRLEHARVGSARVIAARTRPRLIGGERAKYTL